MYLHTGRKVQQVRLWDVDLGGVAGDATLEDILPILERRERELSDLERQRLARKERRLKKTPS